jgi:hypothetical protein
METFRQTTELLLSRKWDEGTEEAVIRLLKDPNIRYFLVSPQGDTLTIDSKFKNTKNSFLIVQKTVPTVDAPRIMNSIQIKTFSRGEITTKQFFGEFGTDSFRGKNFMANIPDLSAFQKNNLNSVEKFQNESKLAAFSTKVGSLLATATDRHQFEKQIDNLKNQFSSNFAQKNTEFDFDTLMVTGILGYLEGFWNSVFVFNLSFDQTSSKLNLLAEVISAHQKRHKTPQSENLHKAQKRLKTLIVLRGTINSSIRRNFAPKQNCAKKPPSADHRFPKQNFRGRKNPTGTKNDFYGHIQVVGL